MMFFVYNHNLFESFDGLAISWLGFVPKNAKRMTTGVESPCGAIGNVAESTEKRKNFC
jgi:hypothetical protein